MHKNVVSIVKSQWPTQDVAMGGWNAERGAWGHWRSYSILRSGARAPEAPSGMGT